MSNAVNYQSTVVAEVRELINQLLDMYELMHNFAESESRQVDVSFLSGTDIHASGRILDSNPDSCEDYAMSSALSDAFSGEERARLKVTLQKIVNEHPNIGADLIETKLLSANFTISTTGFAAGGSWQEVDKPLHITTLYGPDEIDGLTQVTFSATMVNGNTIKMNLNDDLTVFDGIPLNILKEQTSSSSLIKKCLADTLDVMYKKTVQGSGSSSPAYNNVPLVVVGGGIPTGSGGGRRETCKHTYYINDVEVMSFEGTCP